MNIDRIGLGRPISALARVPRALVRTPATIGRAPGKIAHGFGEVRAGLVARRAGLVARRPGPGSSRPADPASPVSVSGVARRGNPVAEARVAAMFDEIAPVYDRLNTIMTLGFDGGWRRAAVEATELRSGSSALDVACGTGKLSNALADRVGPFGRVVGVDLSGTMIDIARRTHPDLVQLEFRVGNALGLPFRDGEFDAATIAFGLRNLSDFRAGFRELGRIVRPGGWVVCLELALPRPTVLGRVYHWVFRHFAPFVGSIFGRRRAYEYLPASLEGFPDPDELARDMRAAGLEDVSFRRLALGAVALHRGRVPAR